MCCKTYTTLSLSRHPFAFVRAVNHSYVNIILKKYLTHHPKQISGCVYCEYFGENLSCYNGNRSCILLTLLKAYLSVTRASLIQVMARFRWLFGPMLTHWQLHHLNKDTRISFQNAFENTVCKMAAILFRLQCVDTDIEAETEWPPHCSRYLRMHFIQRRYSYFDPKLTEVCSLVSNWQ